MNKSSQVVLPLGKKRKRTVSFPGHVGPELSHIIQSRLYPSDNGLYHLDLLFQQTLAFFRVSGVLDAGDL